MTKFPRVISAFADMTRGLNYMTAAGVMRPDGMSVGI